MNNIDERVNEVLMSPGIRYRMDQLELQQIDVLNDLTAINITLPINVIGCDLKWYFFAKGNKKSKDIIYLLVYQCSDEAFHYLFEIDTVTKTSSELITQVWEKNEDMEWHWPVLYKASKLLLDIQDINKYKFVPKPGDKNLRVLYTLVQELRHMLNTLKSLLVPEFKRLVIDENLFDLEVRSVENKDYIVKNECDPSWILYREQRYEFIVCSKNLPSISYIVDRGVGNGPCTVVFNEGNEVTFELDKGFFMEGRTMNEMFDEDYILHLLDIFIGHQPVNNKGIIE